MKKTIIICLFLLTLDFLLAKNIFAAECKPECVNSDSIDDLKRCAEECSEILGIYQGANLKNKETAAAYETQVKRFGAMIAAANGKIKAVEEDIIDREVDLGVQQILLNQRIRRLYIHQRENSIISILFSSQNSSEFIRNFFYQQTVVNEDKGTIEDLGRKLTGLKADKESLEKNQKWLAVQKQEAANQAKFLKQEVEKTEEYLDSLSSTIKSLSDKQKSLLAARSGTFTSSVGDVPISFIPCSGPPGSPSFCDPGGGDWFAVFSFGAWTHRKGMSQYGAKGRADQGQNYQQILQAYYGKTPVNKDTGGTISVSGYGNLNFEDYYLYGIAEMPSSWHREALRAQAIAARTYAYRYKIAGNTICVTEACQVFSRSKADNPPSAWREAVNETRGQVLEDVVTYYSSTTGGYLTTSGWDTTDGQGGSGFASRAWESKAGSPWFYSSWYTQTYNSNSAKCGRSHPWLNSEEMADILNAWIVGNDERILPVTINSCSIGGVTGNPYSIAELRDKANEKGGAFTAVSSVSVTYSNDGYTSSVTFQTNKGSVTIPGSEFKQAFNLRAPGYIAIRSLLFNVEKK
ncbi:MAG: SpoIID/LytB domain-containing protein [Patescibacteria group bacterium]|nr:hypothetical protein [Patescibacteria group bacterium]